MTWTDEALCAQTAPDIFFPESGDRPTAARQICSVCPVRVECLGYALENGIGHGVWGGFSPRQRAGMRA